MRKLASFSSRNQTEPPGYFGAGVKASAGKCVTGAPKVDFDGVCDGIRLPLCVTAQPLTFLGLTSIAMSWAMNFPFDDTDWMLNCPPL